MPVWKVLLIALLFFVCLGLATATLIFPTTVEGRTHPWLYGSGLLGATAVMGGLFTLFLRRTSRLMR
jgi:hypothetical protein